MRMSAHCPDCGLAIEFSDEAGQARCPACDASLGDVAAVPLEDGPAEPEEPTAKPCPHCGRPIPVTADDCPHGCGDVTERLTCPVCKKTLPEPRYGKVQSACSGACLKALEPELREQTQVARDAFSKRLFVLSVIQFMATAALGIGCGGLALVCLIALLVGPLRVASGGSHAGDAVIAFVALFGAAVLGFMMRGLT